MDQWRSKFSESFSLDRYWSIERSSLLRFARKHLKTLELIEKNCAVHVRVLDDRFSAQRLLRSSGAHPKILSEEENPPEIEKFIRTSFSE